MRVAGEEVKSARVPKNAEARMTQQYLHVRNRTETSGNNATLHTYIKWDIQEREVMEDFIQMVQCTGIMGAV